MTIVIKLVWLLIPTLLFRLTNCTTEDLKSVGLQDEGMQNPTLGSRGMCYYLRLVLAPLFMLRCRYCYQSPLWEKFEESRKVLALE